MLGLKSSATMTSALEALLELSSNKAYFYEAYDGFKMVANNVKDVYVNAHFV